MSSAPRERSAREIQEDLALGRVLRRLLGDSSVYVELVRPAGVRAVLTLDGSVLLEEREARIVERVSS